MKIMLMHITNFMTTFYNKATDRIRTGRFLLNIKHFRLSIAIPILGLVLLLGCEEDPTKIGSGILPPSDFTDVAATDTFTVVSYTNYLDTIRSLHPTYSYLGSALSPYFGKTEGGFATQMWLFDSWPGDRVSVDSIKLTLEINDILGELPTDQIGEIWEIDEFMHLDTVYYTSREVPKKQLLGTFSLNGVTNTDTIMTFDLPLSFADELLRDTTQIFLSSDSVDFRNYFNGLYFEYPQSSNYHMLKVNMLGGISRLSLYYTDTTGISQVFFFLFNTKAVYHNTFKHDYTAAEPGKEIKYINQEITDTVSYVQGFNGVYTTIRIPGLEQLRDQMPIGINKARLYMPVYFNESDFIVDNVPASLIGRYSDSDGNRYLLKDYELSSEFFDGKFYELDEIYKLNITTFVQEYLEGLIEEPEIELILPGFSSENGILWANNGSKAPRFELVLTDANQ